MNPSPDKKLLVVMAKEPVAGKVKTRLSPALSAEEAATLYQCMLTDRLREMGRLENIDLSLAFTPSSAKEAFMPLASPRLRLLAQRGKDLGERLHNIFVDAFAAGYAAVSIIDSDSPDLPDSIVGESFRLLLAHRAEVVFGPCTDGGYYLVGMRRPHPELFDDIPWSTPRVLEASMAKSREAGIKTELLCLWNDLDTFEDLLVFYAKYGRKEKASHRSGRETFVFLSRLKKIKRSHSGGENDRAKNPG